MATRATVLEMLPTTPNEMDAICMEFRLASTLVDGGRNEIVNLFFFSFSLWERIILYPLPEQSSQGLRPHPEVEDRVYVS